MMGSVQLLHCSTNRVRVLGHADYQPYPTYTIQGLLLKRERDSLLVRVWKIKYLATVMRNEEGYFCFNQSDYTSYAILHYVHP